LPESKTLLFASGVTDEMIARLDAPPLSGQPERIISNVNQARRRYLEDARGHLRSAARLAPTDMQIRLHLGRVLALLDSDDALEPLGRAAKSDDVETRFLAALFIGGFHQQRKRPIDAIAWYEQATRLIPGASPASVALSQALQLAGRNQDARRVLIESTKGARVKPGYGPWENYPLEVEPDLRKVWAPLIERIDE
jgi:tetratricopeptide (TPR) repeat protein